jgi:hypothetical protein
MCLSVDMMRFLSSELPPLACRNQASAADGTSVKGCITRIKHLKQVTNILKHQVPLVNQRHHP